MWEVRVAQNSAVSCIWDSGMRSPPAAAATSTSKRRQAGSLSTLSLRLPHSKFGHSSDSPLDSPLWTALDKSFGRVLRMWLWDTTRIHEASSILDLRPRGGVNEFCIWAWKMTASFRDNLIILITYDILQNWVSSGANVFVSLAHATHRSVGGNKKTTAICRTWLH